jgi:formyltetrahydrofolate deformylase
MENRRRFILSLSCPDRVGLVATVSGFIAQYQGWITEAHYHADHDQNRFFMRQEILADSLPFDKEEFGIKFSSIAQELQMDWRLSDSMERKRVIILASKPEHCLYDLLARWRSGELAMDIPCVISNHETHRQFVEWHGIPFIHIPVTVESKACAYAKMAELFEFYRADAIVLARYMQVLSAELCDRFPEKMINIHHSFLPSFVGAKPYHQAYSRGVKLIGATCHFVTAELDAGPIIEQDVIRIDHSDSVDDLMRYGKDIEKTVLARGLRYFLEDRILVHGHKTVVFR